MPCCGSTSCFPTRKLRKKYKKLAKKTYEQQIKQEKIRLKCESRLREIQCKRSNELCRLRNASAVRPCLSSESRPVITCTCNIPKPCVTKCKNKKRDRNKPKSLSEIAWETLFLRECKCTPHPTQPKPRRRRKRPPTRNLGLRCILCWTAVGAIAFFAGYFIPILAAVIPPP